MWAADSPGQGLNAYETGAGQTGARLYLQVQCVTPPQRWQRSDNRLCLEAHPEHRGFGAGHVAGPGGRVYLHDCGEVKSQEVMASLSKKQHDDGGRSFQVERN